MRIRPLVMLACASLLAATACGNSTSATSETSAYLEAHDVARARPASILSYGDLAEGNQQLGYELARTLPTSDGNLVLSPASLSIAFAMLREGAVGRTAAEIDRVLHLPANRSAAYNGLLQDLASTGPDTDLEVNDGLFLDPSLTVKQDFLQALKKWYGSGVEHTAFPHPALEVINRWVDAKTHGRIPKLLDHLDQGEVFALVNTVYLQAKWQHPFSASDTSKSDFTMSNGNDTTVSMMHSTSRLDYAAGATWQAVRLPYRESALSMVVLLPRRATATGVPLFEGVVGDPS
jgi:serine protease inhibitor